MKENKAISFGRSDANDVFLVMEDAVYSANSLATQFKVCPLCGGINSVEVTSCFVCSWHGEFEHDPHVIVSSFDGLLERCPGLMDAVSPNVRPTWWQRMLARMGFKKLDIQA